MKEVRTLLGMKQIARSKDKEKEKIIKKVTANEKKERRKECTWNERVKEWSTLLKWEPIKETKHVTGRERNETCERDTGNDGESKM